MATVAWRVPPSSRTEVTGSQALARLVNSSAGQPAQARPDGFAGQFAHGRLDGVSTPVQEARIRLDDTSAPVPPALAESESSPRGLRLRLFAAVALVVALAVAAYVFWSQGDGISGRWTGSAAHPSAGRVFPVDIRLDEGAQSSMRWGADLHCSGILQPTGNDLAYELRHVAGAACYPGTLRIRPTGDGDQLAITVIRQGQQEVTYSGKVARSS